MTTPFGQAFRTLLDELDLSGALIGAAIGGDLGRVVAGIEIARGVTPRVPAPHLALMPMDHIGAHLAAVVGIPKP